MNLNKRNYYLKLRRLFDNYLNSVQSCPRKIESKLFLVTILSFQVEEIIRVKFSIQHDPTTNEFNLNYSWLEDHSITIKFIIQHDPVTNELNLNCPLNYCQDYFNLRGINSTTMKFNIQHEFDLNYSTVARLAALFQIEIVRTSPRVHDVQGSNVWNIRAFRSCNCGHKNFKVLVKRGCRINKKKKPCRSQI